MPHPSPAAPGAQASVLVVDDQKDVADSLAQYLRSAAGHQVRVAYDGARAIRMATAAVPDVVVCDMAMPKLPGLRVAEEIGKLEPRPLLIAVTAFSGLCPEAAAREAGFDVFLKKPADPLALAALIRDHKQAAGSATGSAATETSPTA
jgi:CheY-like chemotaxis protein